MRTLSTKWRSWRLLAALTPGAALVVGCHALEPRVPAIAAFALPRTVAVRVHGRITKVPLDDYVLGSVLAEVTPVTESAVTSARIYDVQAVLARTYAMQGETSKARTAYQDFFTLWKDADRNIPVLQQAKAAVAVLR